MAKSISRRNKDAKSEESSAPTASGFPAPRKFSPEEVAEAVKQAREAITFTRSNWFKFDPDESLLRLLPSFSETNPNPWITADVSKGKYGDKYRTIPTFGSRKAEMVQLYEQAENLTNEDLSKATRFGDPFQVLTQMIRSVEGANVPSNLRPQTRSYWVTFDAKNLEAGPQLLDASRSFLDGVLTLIDTAGMDTLFDLTSGVPVLVKGNGKPGKARRYKDPMIPYGADPIELTLEEGTPLPSPEGFLRSQVMRYDDKVRLMFDTFGDLCRQFGLEPQTFGVTD